MSITYRVQIAVKYTLDIEVPDNVIAKGLTEASAYARKHGQQIWEDDEQRTTYTDEPVEEIVHVTAYPKVET
jgi:hypothetical protein